MPVQKRYKIFDLMGHLWGWSSFGCILGSICTEYWVVEEIISPELLEVGIRVLARRHIGIYRTCYDNDETVPQAIAGQCGPSEGSDSKALADSFNLIRIFLILGCVLTLIGQLVHTAAAIKARRQSHGCGGARNWHLIGGWIQFIACIFVLVGAGLFTLIVQGSEDYPAGTFLYFGTSFKQAWVGTWFLLTACFWMCAAGAHADKFTKFQYV